MIHRLRHGTSYSDRSHAWMPVNPLYYISQSYSKRYEVSCVSRQLQRFSRQSRGNLQTLRTKGRPRATLSEVPNLRVSLQAGSPTLIDSSLSRLLNQSD